MATGISITSAVCPVHASSTLFGRDSKGWAASMAAHAPTSGRQELHHRVPQCLLRLRDRADAHPELDGEGLQLWLDFELEALHHGIDPDISREELAALIEGS